MISQAKMESLQSAGVDGVMISVIVAPHSARRESHLASLCSLQGWEVELQYCHLHDTHIYDLQRVGTSTCI